MKRLIYLLVAAAAAVLAGAAVAGSPPTSTDMLKFFHGGNGVVSWTSEGGSSTADNQALKLSGTTQGTDYSGAYAVNATSAGTLLSEFNASFDVKGYQGAGSPRISLPVDTTGDGLTDFWAYLSASYATGNARSPAANGFDHVDFQQSGATIYTSMGGLVLNGLSDPLSATGSITYQYGGFSFAVTDAGPRSAWTVATDNQPFLILDEAPAVSYVDNLTIGNYNWQRPGKPGFVKDVAPANGATTDSGTMHWTNGAGDSFDVTDIVSVVIDGTHVAFSGTMSNGTGAWAAYDDQVIQEYLDTVNGNLYGQIGGTNVAPASPGSVSDGPFPYTGTVTVG